MERYLVIKEVGFGTFGNVWRAVNKENGETVAIKKMKKKYYCWKECMNLREVKSLRKMNHSNIVKLKEVIREHDVLYFIFEYMDCNLYQLMRDKEKPFSEYEIRNLCFQVFQALAYLHQQGYFHRDLKPENLLMSKGIIKVADFGLAREISSNPPFTEYVSTRWYRAPEVLLQSSVYGPPVDMWAMGAIMAELFNLHPLFPGTNETDEVHKICSVIGSPDENSWVDGLLLAEKIKFQFPQYTAINLSMLIPSASEYAISLISSLCSWDPLRRPTAAKALQHPFFKPCYYIPPSFRLRDAGLTKALPPAPPEYESARRYYVGSLANNFASGVQRKDFTSWENSSAQQLYKPSEKTIPGEGYLGRTPHDTWNMSQKHEYHTVSSDKVGDITEKLTSLTVNSCSQPMKPPPLALKTGSWNPHTRYLNRSYEIPSARGYSRKAVG